MRMLVAVHKSAAVPSDSFYRPVHVGHALASGDLGYDHDDTGDNISVLNPSYCELTAVYWAHRNLGEADADGVGLSHYRRYFSGEQPGPRGRAIMSERQARETLARFDMVLAARRNYVIETVESHYRHGHHGSDLDEVRLSLQRLSPEYVGAWDRIMSGRSLSLYNMFLMRRAEFDRYGDWLFSVLDDAAGRIDNGGRSGYQHRTFGYLGERLLNAYALARSGDASVGRRRVVNTDGEPKVAKALAMARRKFTGVDPRSH